MCVNFKAVFEGCVQGIVQSDNHLLTALQKPNGFKVFLLQTEKRNRQGGRDQSFGLQDKVVWSPLEEA